MEKIKILSVKDGSFEGDNGRVEYYWYKGVRLSDGASIEFGSKHGDYEKGGAYEIELEKRETAKPGKFRYVDITLAE